MGNRVYEDRVRKGQSIHRFSHRSQCNPVTRGHVCGESRVTGAPVFLNRGCLQTGRCDQSGGGAGQQASAATLTRPPPPRYGECNHAVAVPVAAAAGPEARAPDLLDLQRWRIQAAQGRGSGQAVGPPEKQNEHEL